MPVTVHVIGEADPGWVDEVYDEFATMDAVFSPFRPESEVSRINRGELLEANSGALVLQAIQLCRLYEQATNGYFSAWLGGRFDPSGLVKGWAIDRATSILARKGCRNFFVDAGGDVQVRGGREDGSPWRVGIRHPVSRESLARVAEVRDLAVATSGTYEKGGHILDPHTLTAVCDLLSFTVIGPDILQADVYATAGLAMGAGGLEFIDRVPGYEAYAIDRDLTASWTPGFDQHSAPAS